MSTNQASPTAGWYPDPGGSGLRYWDGAAWTDRTEQDSPSSPDRTRSLRALSRGRRIALLASILAALIVVDVGIRNVQMKRFMEEAFASEAAMLSYMQEIDSHFTRLPTTRQPSDAEWATLFDRIHESATDHYYELTYRNARVEAVPFLPWHRNAVEAKRRYLEHNIAWSTELDAVAGDPSRLLNPVPNDIGATWQITKVALRNAVPMLDLLGIRADVERFIAEGEPDGNSA